MKRPLKVLLVEDSEDDASLILKELGRGGYEPQHERVEDAPSMRRALANGAWELILSDWSMPQFSGLDALRLLKEHHLDVPFIIVSGTIGEDTAVTALRAGALDFLLKDKLSRLGPAVERELRERTVREARRQAEEKLQTSEARYRALFEASPLPMWVFDLETLAFVEVNDAAVRHYGYARDEFARMTIEDIRPPGDVALLHKDLAAPKKADGGSTWRHVKKGGAVIDVEVKAHDFELDGRRARLVLVNDVTERKRAEEALRKTEEQLRHAQKMEAVGRLAGGIAHDFNNVLSVILSYAGLLLTDIKGGDPMKADLEEIKKAGLRAADLTRQLLAFSRQQVIDPQILDLNEVLGGLDKMLRRVLGEDVEFVMLPTQSLAKVRVDRGHIEQVIMNLVVNARDAMPTGGKLTVQTANVQLDEEYAGEHIGAKAGPHVLVAVSDSGMGMDKATQARIFEPFFTTKEPGKGTGLGLSTVFGIVQQSGGNIWVYSEPGKGTTFRIYFPHAEEEGGERRQSPPPPPRASRGSETILLVEDEEQVRAVARGILRRSGYHVLEASNAGEALLICEQHKPKIHLLLTDVVLPRTSGTEMAERLRSLRPGMRVLFMSGYTGEAVVHHGMLGSDLPFLQKPLTPESLSRKVREVLDTA